MRLSNLPSTVANLDHNVVIDALSSNACNVTDAAHALGVPVSDLRRLCWATPRLQDRAFEQVEARLDLAEKAVFEALNSDDPRRKDAAAFFCLRNTGSAKRRGWLTSSTAGVDVTINAPKRETIFTWRPMSSSLNSEEAKAEEAHRLAEVARAEEAGVEVLTLSWRSPDDPADDNETEVAERDGARFPVPRYARPPAAIERQPQPEPASEAKPEPAPLSDDGRRKHADAS